MNFLPVSILPMPGGIYNDQTWKLAKRKHIELTKNKILLGEALDSIQISKREISSKIIGTTHIFEENKCWDVLYIKLLAKGDFTGDGLADVILRTSRFERGGGRCGEGPELGSASIILMSRTKKNGIAVFEK